MFSGMNTTPNVDGREKHRNLKNTAPRIDECRWEKSPKNLGTEQDIMRTLCLRSRRLEHVEH